MQDLTKLSDSELLELLDKTERNISEYDTFQMTLKILMNSLYGALANKYFPLFNPEIAKGITSNGRYFIRGMADYVNEAINDILKGNNQGVSKNYIAYGDTDSLVGVTVIDVNGKKITIEDFYDSIEDKVFLKNDENAENYVVDLSEYEYSTPSVSKDLEIQHNKIKYIMKHKVKKEMFKITVGEKSVIVTEDHSVMVLRNNELISVKPRDIQESDEILHL